MAPPSSFSGLSLLVALLILPFLRTRCVAAAVPRRSSSVPAPFLALLDVDAFAGLRGACACTWPPKDPKSTKSDCAPRNALCGYCQNAVYQVSVGAGAGGGCSTATDSGMEACQKVAKEADGKKTAIAKHYKDLAEQFGGSGGWSTLFCLTMGCCKTP